MSIVKRKVTTNYSVVPNSIANDQRLSLEARGMLVMLLAKPHDWCVRVSALQIEANIGRDKCYRILKELSDVGYIETRRIRAQGGKFAAFDYIVHDQAVPAELNLNNDPVPENPFAVKPLTEKPNTVKPNTAKPRLENKDTYIVNRLIIPPKPPREVLRRFPAMKDYVLTDQPSMRDLINMCGTLHSMLNIRHDLLDKAIKQIGECPAVIITGVVFDGYEKGEVRTPGGAFASMLKRAANDPRLIERWYHNEFQSEKERV